MIVNSTITRTRLTEILSAPDSTWLWLLPPPAPALLSPCICRLPRVVQPRQLAWVGEAAWLTWPSPELYTRGDPARCSADPKSADCHAQGLDAGKQRWVPVLPISTARIIACWVILAKLCKFEILRTDLNRSCLQGYFREFSQKYSRRDQFCDWSYFVWRNCLRWTLGVSLVQLW